ncbi:unnamed protein product (macronuclear) [Paramecium tetraurelia]|uniref:Cilium assembly protein DZIP1 N-terminal domain-containing protein n=1 Tax=Paramecium tetraurelia TaxID=5888 RepID=A0DZD6_PARTE|nr:uncharacterized protein GSPATT00003372001 [Paramecium tetraurelia]CAK88403.1 unnamed protein product [Paramecium tetraurelia]|eukprot:XP_001455800.1 hypothetical protein (macronuclear) [Paramecium tetraurelia strain d4-2]
MSIHEQLLQMVTDVSSYKCMQICSSLKQEPAVTKVQSTQEILNALKLLIFILLELVSQNKSLEYDELEKAVQKAEAEIRSHVRVSQKAQLQLEQQMKLYTDNLQEKIEQLELEKQQIEQDRKASTLQLNFLSSKEMEKKPSNLSQQREGSPNVVKKSYIMGNQIYHRQHQSNLITYQDQQIPNKTTSQEPINRERRSANTQHISYIPGKGLPLKNNVSHQNNSIHNPPSNRKDDRNKSQQSQERVIDKSQSLLKSQNSYSYIKMYNIQKLIINKNQNDNIKQATQLTQQTKSKTIHGVCNNILDESHYKKK